MELFIDRICSKNLGPIIEKKRGGPIFTEIIDLTPDINNTVILNLKIPINKIYRNIYSCSRPLDNVVFLNRKDLRNVLLNKQPNGHNPILSDNRGNVYTLHKDFSIDTTFNIKVISHINETELFITFLTYYSKAKISSVKGETLEFFNIDNGNPTFDDNKVIVNDSCKFVSNAVRSLNNCTIYIAMTLSSNTKMLLTDGITNIVLDSTFRITDGHFETVPIPILPYKSYTFACVITNDILVYTYLEIPKSGEYYNYNTNGPVTLTIEDCTLYNISIYSEIHNQNKINYILYSLSNEYNV